MTYTAFKRFVEKWGIFDPLDHVLIGWKKFTVWDLEGLVRGAVKEHEWRKEKSQNFPRY